MSKRMEALLKAHPRGNESKNIKLGTKYAGWYYAPNGQRYFGLGMVVETGLTHDGGIYVRVAPRAGKPDIKWDFFDPFTDEDMPSDQIPKEEHIIHNQNCIRYPRRDEYKMRKPPQGLKPGTVAFGEYESLTRRTYHGVGRIVGELPYRMGGFRAYAVEPKRGGFTFWHSISRYDILPDDMPRSAYSGSAETQANENPARPRRKFNEDHPMIGGIGGLPKIGYIQDGSPKMGSEHVGAYIAPDGQWFVGVGKVIAVGDAVNIPNLYRLHVMVEPIPGKRGGDYDFFHPTTYEWMDELPMNPIPGQACPVSQARSLPQRWRDLPAIRRRPDIGEEYAGRYRPPNAPVRDVYLGVGKVVKTGVTKTKKSQIWVEVEPIPGKTFFDPWTGKDMPDEYYPEDCL